MASDSPSFFREVMRALFVSLFRVIGIGAGLVILIVIIAVLANTGGPTKPKYATITLQPNHDWKIAPFSTQTPTILQLNVQGVIGLQRQLQAEEVRKILVESMDGDLKPGQIKAVLLNIDSPGGTVRDSAAIYNLIKEYKAHVNVPVIAYVDGLCASGGMYIASAADRIIATESSVIGSVGVLMPTAFNVSALMSRIGIDATTIYAGTGKDELNPFRPWKEDEEEPLQKVIDESYEQFVSIVSTARPQLTSEKLKALGANVFLAKEAQQHGFIDEVNDSYFTTLAALAKAVHIHDSYQVISFQTGGILEELFGSDASAMKGKLQHYLRLPGDLHPDLLDKGLYLYQPAKGK